MTPEMGVGIYETDFTQGPACAIACGAGTIVRNYLALVEGRLGQTRHRKVDCLSEIGRFLQNERNGFWYLKNGYAFAEKQGLERVNLLLQDTDEQSIIERLKVGVQWNTEVTLPDAGHCVTQVYCSALPLGYSDVLPRYWEPFAKSVLKAAYLATLATGVLNAQKTGNNRVFLTLVGGGVFNNPPEWIAEALLNACVVFRDFQLDCRLVSFGNSLEAGVIIDRFNRLSDAC